MGSSENISVVFLLLTAFTSMCMISADVIVNKTRQTDLTNLFKELNCVRSPKIKDILNNIDPMKYLHLYKNPTLTENFIKDIQDDQLFPRTGGQFPIHPFIVGQVVTLFDILYNIDTSSQEGWDLFYNSSVSFSQDVNPSQFVWALKAVLNSKFYGLYESPPLFEIFPQLFLPRDKILELNGNKVEITPGRIQIQEAGPESVLSYYRSDAVLNDFHAHWHIDYPQWWDDGRYDYKKERQGEFFMYTHHQIINRQNAERLSNGLQLSGSLILDPSLSLRDGFIPEIINSNFQDFPSRPNNTKVRAAKGLSTEMLHQYEVEIKNAIRDGFLINNQGEKIPLRGSGNVTDLEGASLLGAVIEASVKSVNYGVYGNIHNQLHVLLASSAPPKDNSQSEYGVLAFTSTAMQDPAFYNIHTFVDSFYKLHKSYFLPYTSEDIGFPGVDLLSVSITTQKLKDSIFGGLWPFQGIPTLTTFFESQEFDGRNAVQNCSQLNKTFPVKMTRLNYHQFTYKLSIFSTKWSTENGIVRIFLSPLQDFDGRFFSNQELYWKMMEMDKFPLRIRPGMNAVQRSSSLSSITIGEGRKKVFEDEEQIKYDKPFRFCAYPSHLLLPKGTSSGMKFKMFAMISKTDIYYDEKDFPCSSICGIGNATYPDSKPLGFPFDRMSNENGLPKTSNYKFFDVIIKHLTQR